MARHHASQHVQIEPLEPRRFLSANGIIVFNTNRDGNYEIYLMAPDGTHVKNLTYNSATDAIPQVLDDGTKVAFASDRGHPVNMDIWLMDIDGTNLVNITHNGLPGATNWDPVPSPDNSKVLYMGSGDVAGDGYDLWVSDANGANPVNLTPGKGGGDFASWSDDGTKICLGDLIDKQEEVFYMNADGSGRTQVTHDPGAIRRHHQRVGRQRGSVRKLPAVGDLKRHADRLGPFVKLGDVRFYRTEYLLPRPSLIGSRFSFFSLVNFPRAFAADPARSCD